MTLVGRIAPGSLWYGSSVITLELAADAVKFRVGDVFWTACSPDWDSRRPGDHRVRRVDVDAGVVVAEVPIHTTSPAACAGDWLLMADHAPQWSPYQ